MTDPHEATFVAPAELNIVRVLPGTREQVWQYLIDPDLRKLWFCGGATGSKPGDDFVMEFDHSRISETSPPDDVGCGDPITMKGRILTFDPPNVLTYEWPGDHGGDTVVTIRLTEEGDHTRLSLTHERLTSSEFKLGASAGWHAHLDLLVDLMNGRPARDFWVHYSAVKLRYETTSSNST